MVQAPVLKNLINNLNEYNMFSKFTLIWDFLKVRKKWWLTPIILFLLLLSLIIVLAQGSAIAPFIYAIF